MKSPARQRSLIATLIVLLFPIVSYADASDTEARIQDLQKQVQQMSEARAEQDVHQCERHDKCEPNRLIRHSCRRSGRTI